MNGWTDGDNSGSARQYRQPFQHAVDYRQPPRRPVAGPRPRSGDEPYAEPAGPMKRACTSAPSSIEDPARQERSRRPGQCRRHLLLKYGHLQQVGPRPRHRGARRCRRKSTPGWPWRALPTARASAPIGRGAHGLGRAPSRPCRRAEPDPGHRYAIATKMSAAELKQSDDLMSPGWPAMWRREMLRQPPPAGSESPGEPRSSPHGPPRAGIWRSPYGSRRRRDR